MLVAFDAGNSQVTIGVHDGSSWLAQWRVASDPARTVDETAVLLRALFASSSIDPAGCGRAIASSVVPELGPVIRETALRLTGCEPLMIGPGVKTGMRIRYRPAHALGTDRLADAVAGRALAGAPVVVVDFGTATTFNVVDPDGDFVGGAIAPGVGTSASALAAGGARLSRIGLREVGTVPSIGRNTIDAMLAGVLHGYAGMVGGLLERIEREIGHSSRVPVIATGGHAESMIPFLSRIDRFEPSLTLDGLRHIAAVNA